MASDLQSLRAAADAASDAFDRACRPYYVNRRDYYLACERDPGSCPASVHAACDAYLEATHAFYLARDGEKGFLGGRGL